MSSTALITDINSVITNGPNAATKIKANAAAGPIMDYQANCNLVQLHFREMASLIKAVIQDTDSTDSANLTLLNGVQALLNGTGGPSTQAVTDIKTVYTNGPNAASLAKANAAAGPLMLYLGNVKLLQRKAEEAKVLIGGYASDPDSALISVTDSTDTTNLSLLQGIVAVLV